MSETARRTTFTLIPLRTRRSSESWSASRSATNEERCYLVLRYLGTCNRRTRKRGKLDPSSRPVRSDEHRMFAKEVEFLDRFLLIEVLFYSGLVCSADRITWHVLLSHLFCPTYTSCWNYTRKTIAVPTPRAIHKWARWKRAALILLQNIKRYFWFSMASGAPHMPRRYSALKGSSRLSLTELPLSTFDLEGVLPYTP